MEVEVPRLLGIAITALTGTKRNRLKQKISFRMNYCNVEAPKAGTLRRKFATRNIVNKCASLLLARNVNTRAL